MADGAQYDELEESEDVQVDVDYGPLPNQPAVVEASANPPECDTSKLHKHAMGWFDIFIVCCVSTINQLYVSPIESGFHLYFPINCFSL